MKPQVPRYWLAVLTLLAAMSVRGGIFSADFNDGQVPAGTTLIGNAIVDSSGGPDGSGCLKLTPAATSQNGGIVLPDLDNNNRIETFVATFNLHMGNGTTPPADGFSFNFGQAPVNATWGEQGIVYGAGLAGISVGFDVFDNGTADDQEAPEVCVRFYAGSPATPQLVARRKLTNQVKTGAGYVPVLIRMNNAGTLDVYVNNTALFTNLFIAGTGSAGWRFSLAARTGGSYEEHWIDDLNITTVQQANTKRYIKTSIPLPSPILANSTNAVFRMPFQDSGTYPIDTNATVLYFNGVQVPIDWQYNSNGGGAIISQPVVYYDPRGLPPGSVNTAKLIVADSSGQGPDTYYWTFSLTNAPLWTIAPGTRMLNSAEGSTPTCRSLAYSPLSNHVYVASRKGSTTGNIYVLNANTGADLYQLNTAVIATGANIPLLGVAVGDEGAVYAANEVNAGTTPNVNIYRWTTPDSATPGELIYSGQFASSYRWGDTFDARGFKTNAQFIMDAQNGTITCLFSPDGSGGWTPNLFTHPYTGTVIGRQIQFGPTNTYYLKKKQATGNTSALPLNLMTSYSSSPGDQGTATVLSSVVDYHYQLGSMGIDSSNKIGAGIFFATGSTSYDRLYLYDLSNLESPLQVATYNANLSGNGAAQQCYNFPVTHVANANFIAQVVIGGGKIFAIDANNGIIAVPELPPAPTIAPAPPKMSVVSSNGSIVISWPATGAGEVLQANPSLSPGNWSNTGLTPTSVNGVNSVTITPGAANYYRLAK